MNILIKKLDKKKVLKKLLKSKKDVEQASVNFILNINSSLFIYKKDKEIIMKINRKLSEVNIDMAELMHRFK